MIDGIPAEVRELLRLPEETADPALIPLIASLKEAISGMSAVDVTGVEPSSDLSFPRGWSGVGV